MGQLIRGAPGIYLQGLASEPVLQLSAITGFVGIAERGPLHLPQPIRTWDEFLTVFGQSVDYGYLPDAVFGFFRNGGGKCFVVRVADTQDFSSENIRDRCPRVDLLRAAANVFPINDRTGAETIRITAINEGRWGNRIRYNIRAASQRHMQLTTLAQDASSAATTLRVADAVDFDPDMEIRLVPPAGPFDGTLAQVQSVDAAVRTVTLKAAPGVALVRGTVVLGQGFKLIVRSDERTEVFDNLSMSPTHPRYIMCIVNGADKTLPYIDRQTDGHSILIRVSQVFSGTGQSQFRPVAPAAGQDVLAGGGDGSRYGAATLQDVDGHDSITVVARAAPENLQVLGSKGNAVRVRAQEFATHTALAVDAGADSIVVENADGLIVGDGLMLIDPTNAALTETRSIAALGTDNVVKLAAPLDNAHPLGATVTVQQRFTLEVFQGQNLEPAEVHRNLSAVPADSRYFRGVLTLQSKLLCGDRRDVVLQPPIGEALLAGGRDPGTIDFRWYTGYDGDHYFAPVGTPVGKRLGLATLESESEIDIVAMPDLAGQTLLPGGEAAPSGKEALYLLAYHQVLYHAAKCGDRLALVDTLAGVAPEAVVSIPQKLGDPLTAKFGALYYPWLKTTVGDIERSMPPSGFVAGVIARADQEGGVGRAPANYPLRDIVDLEVLLDQTDQDDLNPAGVNCARKFERPAIELWGARTLSSDPTARYLNVRRLLIAVKTAVGQTLLWTVFEPNGPVLWRRIQTSLESLMRTLVAGGATASAAAGSSFFVKCDAETNPPEIVETGQVVANVGIALVAPAEFILLNVKRTPDSVSVTEAGG
jgi:hypothetical protein